jgi:hypothetical protein
MKKSKTLLEGLLEKRRNAISEREREESEVIMAWLYGQISSKEAGSALGVKQSSQVFSKASTILRRLHDKGLARTVWSGALKSDSTPRSCPPSDHRLTSEPEP